MFDLLKSKFKGFTDKLFGKAKEKAEEQEAALGQPTELSQPTESAEQLQSLAEQQEPEAKAVPQEQAEITQILGQQPPEAKAIPQEQAEITQILGQPPPEAKAVPQEQAEITQILGQQQPEAKAIPQEQAEITQILGQQEVPHPPKERHPFFGIFKPKPKPKSQPPAEERQVPQLPSELRPIPETPAKPVEELKPPKVEKREVPKDISIQAAPTDELTIKKSTELKKSLATSIKSIFSSKVKLSEKELSEFLKEFELSLLEADVSLISAENICKDMHEKLVNASFSKDNTLEDIKSHIRDSLKSQLDIDCDINNYMINKKPFVIMFIGPNGAGKTTTISKFANLYKSQNHSVILASADTFRAGSIDQLEKHASAIGVKIIKQDYGSDPAAVAFDAVTSAKANNIDFVLIDTAGRQENNTNLMQELKKIKRVVHPDMIIYIGEAQAGQAIVEQVSGFEKEIGVDGVILTKLDTDPKGGVAISILSELKKPIFYIGTGQGYTDLEKFSPDFIIDRVVA